MNNVRIALAIGLAVTAVAVVVTLLHAPMVVSRKNGVPKSENIIALARKPLKICQQHEYLPKDTTLIQPWMVANNGPRMHLAVLSDGHVIAGGETESGWVSRVVKVPVKPLAHSVSNVEVCAWFSVKDESVGVYGYATPPATGVIENGKPAGGRMWIEYLRPGTRSWASQLRAIFRRMELGRYTTGRWVVMLILILAAGVAALASTLVLKEIR